MNGEWLEQWLCVEAIAPWSTHPCRSPYWSLLKQNAIPRSWRRSLMWVCVWVMSDKFRSGLELTCVRLSITLCIQSTTMVQENTQTRFSSWDFLIQSTNEQSWWFHPENQSAPEKIWSLSGWQEVVTMLTYPPECHIVSGYDNRNGSGSLTSVLVPDPPDSHGPHWKQAPDKQTSSQAMLLLPRSFSVSPPACVCVTCQPVVPGVSAYFLLYFTDWSSWDLSFLFDSSAIRVLKTSVQRPHWPSGYECFVISNHWGYIKQSDNNPKHIFKQRLFKTSNKCRWIQAAPQTWIFSRWTSHQQTPVDAINRPWALDGVESMKQCVSPDLWQWEDFITLWDPWECRPRYNKD